jgi:4,4'-diaponeurosporenoate glycosyltransferase
MRLWQLIECALLLIPGFLVLWRIGLCRPPGRTHARWPRFSIIVPARNEEARLPALLSSLRSQTIRPAEVIVVDDDSEDDTAALARRAGCRVVKAGRRPKGWLGKAWACWVGARHATGKLLLFLDADTTLQKEGCERLLAEHSASGGVLTVQPWHRMGSPIEKLSSFFNLVVMAAVNAFTVFGGRLAPAGCFGPCILCAREDYFRVDGHRSVRESILEDIELGRRFLAHGISVNCRGGKGVISFRMYPGGLRDLIEGWSKNMARGAQGTHPLVLACFLLWFCGCFSASVFAVRWPVSGTPEAAAEALLFYAAYAGQLFWMLRRLGNFGPVSAAMYPVHLVFFAFVFVRSLFLTHLLRRVTWKGREIAWRRGGAQGHRPES